MFVKDLSINHLHDDASEEKQHKKKEDRLTHLFSNEPICIFKRLPSIDVDVVVVVFYDVRF